MSTGTKMIRKLNWPTLSFFIVTTLVAVIGTPLYIQRYGLSLPQILLFLFYVGATGLSITVGYHRLYSHSTFKANPLIHFLVLFFGAAAFEQSALTWSSGHRDHHRYVDTDKDPYSIKKGFWYAHIGWMTLWQQQPDYNNSKDLMKNGLLMNQHRLYVLWGVGAGIVLPVVLGALAGNALGGFILSVCLRLTFVYHATFCINSVCHTFGKPTFDFRASARDNWFAALLTNGEGYHSFHHRFPTDYRNAIRWYQWDPSKWAIRALSFLGMAWDLQKVSRFSILGAVLSSEKQLLSDRLTAVKDLPKNAALRQAIHLQYEALVQNLAVWEASVKQGALDKINKARADFEKARAEWQLLHQASLQLA